MKSDEDREVDLVIRALVQISEEPERFSMLLIQSAASAGATHLKKLKTPPPVIPPVLSAGQVDIDGTVHE